jgi:hypothetical protein
MTPAPPIRQHAGVPDTPLAPDRPILATRPPSGRFLANAAWLVLATLAHNLLRWVAVLGLGSTDLVVAKTLRRRLVTLPGRLTRSARRRVLHLPTDWPWAEQFHQALARLRAVPLRA